MTDRFGLRSADLAYICNVLYGISGLERAVVFGSRAKGNFRKGSDVDIALFGRVDAKAVNDASRSLNEESMLPYHFDLIQYSAIELPELRQHIDRVGQTLIPAP